MASKRRNMFYENKKPMTHLNGPPPHQGCTKPDPFRIPYQLSCQIYKGRFGSLFHHNCANPIGGRAAQNTSSSSFFIPSWNTLRQSHISTASSSLEKTFPTQELLQLGEKD
ncbi:hypothetical protein AAG570_010949 [Ranatra chinensis]|uniref:Uncharacterized protein n=1 Tax=Ranatra chinensis TaxID=642074 RepID=A0ABD0YJG0_9HEMI